MVIFKTTVALYQPIKFFYKTRKPRKTIFYIFMDVKFVQRKLGYNRAMRYFDDTLSIRDGVCNPRDVLLTFLVPVV